MEMETINRTWPAGTSEMAECIPAFDWASPRLGPIIVWRTGGIFSEILIVYRLPWRVYAEIWRGPFVAVCGAIERSSTNQKVFGAGLVKMTPFLAYELSDPARAARS